MQDSPELIPGCFIKCLGDGGPFLLQASLKHRPSRLTVPVTGVANIPFLAVQVGMHPGTHVGMIILGTGMGCFPVAVGIVPESLGDEATLTRYSFQLKYFFRFHDWLIEEIADITTKTWQNVSAVDFIVFE